MIKKSIHQEYKTIVNIYVHDFRAPKYVKEIITNLKEEVANKIIVGNFSTPLSTVSRSYTQNQQINSGLGLIL